MSASAFVRISGPPNSSFLIGYPGIAATLVCSQVDSCRDNQITSVATNRRQSRNPTTLRHLSTRPCLRRHNLPPAPRVNPPLRRFRSQETPPGQAKRSRRGRRRRNAPLQMPHRPRERSRPIHGLALCHLHSLHQTRRLRLQPPRAYPTSLPLPPLPHRRNILRTRRLPPTRPLRCP